MDAAIKQKWVDALRSGEYKQGFCSLHDGWDDSYCCLGVLRELLSKPLRKHRQRNEELLTRAQCDAAGLESQHLWSSRNDTGWTFAEIADCSFLK